MYPCTALVSTEARDYFFDYFLNSCYFNISLYKSHLQNYNQIITMNKKDTLLIRSTLANNVEYLLDKISSYKEEFKNESMDLFDADFNDDKLVFAAPMHINQLDVLLKEKEFLGLYVTENPVLQYTELLSYVRNLTEQDGIYLIILDKVKKIFTKNKDMMFGLELSKEGDKVEGIIFPKNAMALSPLLEEKNLYWAMGKISTPKKKKAEVVVQTEGDFESEDGNQVQEFVELPKLIIENLVPYSDGALKLLNTEELKVNRQRTELLSKIDYESILIDPENFKKYLGNVEVLDDNENSTAGIANLSDNESVKSEIKNYRIDLPSSLDKKKAVELKKTLHIVGHDYMVQVYVQILNGEYKKAKTEYPIAKESLGLILELLK